MPKETFNDEYKQLFDAIIDKSPFPMWLADTSGTLIRANQALRDCLDLRDKDLIGKYNVFNDANLVEQGVIPLVKATFEEKKTSCFKILWESAKTKNVNFKTSRSLFIKGAFFPVIDDNGKIKNVICQWVDISELKKCQGEVETRKEFLDSLIESIHIPIFYRGLNGTYLWINSAYEQFIGLSKDEIFGKNLFDIFPEDLAKDHTAQDQALFESGGPQVYETKAKHANGEEHNMVIYKSIFYDASGEKKGIIGAVMDITERKKVEDKLKESEYKYRLLAENVSDIIWTMDLNLKFTYISESVKKIRGYSAEEAIKQGLDQMLTPASLEYARKIFCEVLEKEKNNNKSQNEYSLELEHYNVDGKAFWMGTNITLLRDSNGVMTGLLGVSRDISGRKESTRKLEENLNYLEQIQEITIDREIRMIELKKEVNQLSELLGKEPPYEIPE